jgi:hypothetical protein
MDRKRRVEIRGKMDKLLRERDCSGETMSSFAERKGSMGITLAKSFYCKKRLGGRGPSLMNARQNTNTL